MLKTSNNVKIIHIDYALCLLLKKSQYTTYNMTEAEMAGWHHRLNGHEFERALGVGDGQGGLACCCPWGHKESDTIEQLN